jgi:hypothetical protein
MANGRERRQHARANISWPVKIETAQGIIKGETINLSPAGAYIQCPETPKPGEEIVITISPSDHSPLHITAEVIWTASAPPFGMGISFLKVSAADSRFLSDAVDKVIDPTINKRLNLS